MLNLFPRTTKPEKKQTKDTHIPIKRCAHKVCFHKKVNVEMTLLLSRYYISYMGLDCSFKNKSG